MAKRELTDLQKDGLRELGNIGSGNAATALSQLLGRDITLSLPAVNLIPVEKITSVIGGGEEVVAAVYLRVFGEIPARTLLIFPQDKIFLMLDLLMKRELGTTKEFTDTEQSGLMEIGNIIISAYLNAIAKFIGLNGVPSVPALAVDMISAVFQTISSEMAEAGEQALFIECDMTEELTQIKAKLFLIPDKDGMDKIIKALDNAISGA